MPNDKVSWRVTYIAHASDSSQPRRTLQFYAETSIVHAAEVAQVLIEATEQHGAKILLLERS